MLNYIVGQVDSPCFEGPHCLHPQERASHHITARSELCLSAIHAATVVFLRSVISQCVVFITDYSAGTSTVHCQRNGPHYCAAHYSWQTPWSFNCILWDFTNFRTFPYTLKWSYCFALLSITSKFQCSIIKNDGQSPKNNHSLNLLAPELFF